MYKKWSRRRNANLEVESLRQSEGMKSRGEQEGTLLRENQRISSHSRETEVLGGEMNEESLLVRVEKKGEGSYGMVYKALSPVDGGEFAVKRNILDDTISFMGSVRELDILTRFVNHPSIVHAKYVSTDCPFETPMSPIRKSRMKDDRIHFVFECANCDLYDFLEESRPISLMLKAMVEILLGLEYIHSKGIIHRDLKPQNILVYISDEGTEFTLCDFGMARPWMESEPHSSRITTCWYRAPEIFLDSLKISPSVDMWSLGCMIVEIFYGKALLRGTEDSDQALCDALLRLFPRITDVYPNIVSRREKNVDTHKERERNARNKAQSHRTSRKPDEKPRSIKTHEEYIESCLNLFSGDSVRHFKELCLGLLQPDPKLRWTATKALDSPLFSDFRKIINKTRKDFPPVPDPLPKMEIVNCIERKWAHRILLRILDKKESYRWFSHRIIFQALDLFDRYLKHEYSRRKETSNREAGLSEGLHSYKGVEIRIITCLYLCIKYFNTLSYISSFSDLLECKLRTNDNIEFAESFEEYLVVDICEHRIYRPTVLEVLGVPISESGVRDLFVTYGSIVEFQGAECWNGMPITAFTTMFLAMRRFLSRVVG